MNCEVCQQRVELGGNGSKVGTRYYIGVDARELERARELLAEAQLDLQLLNDLPSGSADIRELVRRIDSFLEGEEA